LELILQKKSNDCGVACLSMLGGIAYEEAVQLLHGQEGLARTSRKEIRSALTAIKGIDVGPRFVGWHKPRKIDEIDLRFNALLQTNGFGPEGQNWHWIVWDASNKRALDPSGKSPRRTITAYLKAHR